MIIRYFGYSNDDFWCYGTRTEDLNRAVTKWHKENVGRCMQTIGPEIFIAWGKTRQIREGAFFVKKSQYNNRFVHKVRAKAREYHRPMLPDDEQFTLEKIEEIISFKLLQNKF
jgi:hypothetical protein